MTFNQLINELQRLRREGRKGSPEYAETLRKAQRANPNPGTPVGFYLSDYTNTRD